MPAQLNVRYRLAIRTDVPTIFELSRRDAGPGRVCSCEPAITWTRHRHRFIERARERGCHLMQLTSHKSRTDAQRFYEKLGIEKSYIGMKLFL